MESAPVMTGGWPIRLEPVDRAEVTIVVDNFVDLLMAGSDDVRRYLASDFGDRDQLIAEHGFSALVTVESQGRRTSVLYDGGLTPTALARNVIHPEAWRERKRVFPTGNEVMLPPPSRRDLEAEGVGVIEEPGQTLLLDSTVLVSGQVERLTAFERGFPIHYAQTEAGWEPDPMIWDDQNLIVNLRGKGLVIVSGCSHAGAVNVLRNAQRLTGQKRVAGFIGGLHLTGGIFEPIIEPTVDALAAADIDRLLPAHCTGWKAVHQLARALPEAFVQPAVGTIVTF
jgi:7,8-dihydropterin-6-yl-methyl-4-(beta-D-ribofuranosyl)aminobenzene 5'-phosphate synthase